MNTEQALLTLASTTSDAVRDALAALAPGEVLQRGTRVNSAAARATDEIAVPAVVASIAYVDGIEGGNLLLMPVGAARRLAAAMAGQPAPEDSDADLTEMELSAVGEAMNQVMSSAATATGSVLRQGVEIAAPETTVVATQQALDDAVPEEGQATSADFSLFGLDCRFVHLVPPAFLTLLQDALEVDPTGDLQEPLREAMLDVDVRVWAELGRARMSSQRAVALPRGAVVELDREADDAIDLYVDGLHFATGRLVVTDEGELAVRLESVGHADGDHRLGGGSLMARVLVVDDAAFMRKMVTDALTKGGHEVIGEASNGIEAVERYRELRPEVTTLDITMPEKDGLAALQEIIGLDPGARVIMCSALGQESKVLESIKIGAKDFIVKPFKAERVLGAVDKALT